ncbi:MAG: hypothetical protein QXF12_02215 [Candidatus Aenigmatarchaeota archaeon]
MNININNIENNGIIDISDSLKDFINKLNKMRKSLIAKYTKEELDNMPFIYCSTEDDSLKAEIENNMIIYHFPIALVFLRKYAMYVKSYYVEDFFQHCLLVIVTTLRKFDPLKNVLFHTYLSNYMFGEVLKFIDSTKTLKYNYYYLKKKDENIIIVNESDLLNYTSSDDPSFVEMYNYYHQFLNSVDEEDYILDFEHIKSIVKREIYKNYSSDKAEILECLFELSDCGCRSNINIINCLSEKYNINKSVLYDLKRDFIKKIKKQDLIKKHF